MKIKIPPLLLTLTHMFLMWITTLFTHSIPIPFPIKITLCAAFTCLGIYFVAAGVLHFKLVKTTINPYTPNLTSRLVTTGIYAKTRNPMYVGFISLLLAWAFLLSNIFSSVFILLFFIYIDNFQIKPEEQALETLFSEQYITYKNSVRRWL